MYFCGRGIDFDSFYDFSVELHCSDSVVLFLFYFTNTLRIFLTNNNNKMKNKNTTLSNRIRKFYKESQVDTITIHASSLSWLVIDTSIKSGGVRSVNYCHFYRLLLLASCVCIVHFYFLTLYKKVDMILSASLSYFFYLKIKIFFSI